MGYSVNARTSLAELKGFGVVGIHVIRCDDKSDIYNFKFEDGSVKSYIISNGRLVYLD